MVLRIDKVTCQPGLIQSGYTCTLVVKDTDLYVIKTGKYVNWDQEVARAPGSGAAGHIGKAVATKIIDKSNIGKIKEIDENQAAITNQMIEMLNERKDVKKVPLLDIKMSDFSESKQELKLKTIKGKFKFYFSTQSDRDKIKDLINVIPVR